MAVAGLPSRPPSSLHSPAGAERTARATISFSARPSFSSGGAAVVNVKLTLPLGS